MFRALARARARDLSRRPGVSGDIKGIINVIYSRRGIYVGVVKREGEKERERKREKERRQFSPKVNTFTARSTCVCSPRVPHVSVYRTHARIELPGVCARAGKKEEETERPN